MNLRTNFRQQQCSDALRPRDIATSVREGRTPAGERRIGMEVETFCRTASGRRAEYSGSSDSILEVLRRLQRELDAEPVFEDDALVGLQSDQGNISLEPGCQLEWSSPPLKSLDALEQSLREWNTTRDSVLGNVGLTADATALDDCERECDSWPPKKRYYAMKRRYRSKGPRAWVPMQHTASIHLSYDYESDVDWMRKFRVILSAIPASVALFANSAARRFGRNWQSCRPLYWHCMDEHRTRLPRQAFATRFGIDEYAAWAAGIEPMIERDNYGKSTSELAEERLGEIFTPVRSKQLLEVRVNDRLADDDLPTLAAFWTGLLYDAQSLCEAYHRADWFADRLQWERALLEACQQGARTEGVVREQALQLLELSLAGLSRMANCSPAVVDGLSAWAERFERNTAQRPIRSCPPGKSSRSAFCSSVSN
ncbi:glutamate-cysteine ligase family protein [Aeoliella sp. ICT_H6.2]|uniref:glutamate--cysteine ligase n=1 Tax=Aeoliella straminimaris TaxID=2954799 RepID=A0A9X2F6R9_9BACT|nr:glutamate-cysteine ligase family protein [Aeoliella straminimaris]MCO6042653.1 glutamate-cysteine ligase family protein [Aeoliella straminimaris]